MSETIFSPSAAASPDPADQGQAETFCRYLARQFVARKGFAVGTVPEAERLIAASDIVLTQNSDGPFTILCLIDREANPIRTFDLSLAELESIGRDCLRHAGAAEIFGRPEISVAIRVIEVGPTSEARWEQLKALTSNTPDARYHVAALAVDPAKGEVRWNTRLDRPERTFIKSQVASRFGRELYREGASVDVYLRTGDVGSLVGSKEQNGVGDFVDLSGPPHRNDAHTLGAHGRIGGTS